MHTLADLSILTGEMVLIGIVIRYYFSRRIQCVHQEVKDSAAQWLRGNSPALGILAQTSALLSCLLGKKYFSLRSFVVSCLVSLSLFTAIPLLFRQYWLDGGDVSPMTFTLILLQLGMVANLVPDYLSALKGRRIIEVTAHLESRGHITALLCCDIVSSVVIKSLFLVLFSFAVAYLDNVPPLETAQYLLDVIKSIPQGGKVLVASVVFIVPSLSTHFWLGLYSASLLIGRIVYRTGILERLPSNSIRRSQRQETPIQFIGNVATVVGMLGVIALGVLANLAWRL